MSKRKVDEEAKLGVLESKLAPDSLKEHLAVTGEKYSTYMEMKMKIEAYLADRDGLDASDPMDINAVGK